VGHLHLLAIVGFTKLAIPAMMVLGFQAHPQFAIAETLQWCTQLATTQTIKNGGSPTKTINNAPPKKQLQFKIFHEMHKQNPNH